MRRGPTPPRAVSRLARAIALDGSASSSTATTGSWPPPGSSRGSSGRAPAPRPSSSPRSRPWSPAPSPWAARSTPRPRSNAMPRLAHRRGAPPAQPVARGGARRAGRDLRTARALAGPGTHRGHRAERARCPGCPRRSGARHRPRRGADPAVDRRHLRGQRVRGRLSGRPAIGRDRLAGSTRLPTTFVAVALSLSLTSVVVARYGQPSPLAHDGQDRRGGRCGDARHVRDRIADRALTAPALFEACAGSWRERANCEARACDVGFERGVRSMGEGPPTRRPQTAGDRSRCSTWFP